MEMDELRKKFADSLMKYSVDELLEIRNDEEHSGLLYLMGSKYLAKEGKDELNSEQRLDIAERLLVLNTDYEEMVYPMLEISLALGEENVLLIDKTTKKISAKNICGSLGKKIKELKERENSLLPEPIPGRGFLYAVIAALLITAVVMLYVNPTVSGWFNDKSATTIFAIIAVICMFCALAATSSFILTGVAFLVVAFIAYLIEKVMPLYFFLKLVVTLILGGIALYLVYLVALAVWYTIKQKSAQYQSILSSLSSEQEIYRKYIGQLQANVKHVRTEMVLSDMEPEERAPYIELTDILEAYYQQAMTELDG